MLRVVCFNPAIRRSLLDSLWPRSSSDLPLMDLASILAATDNFSKANKLGEGGFGPVYRVSERSTNYSTVVKKLLTEFDHHFRAC